MTKFERIIQIKMPFDKRHPDPSKNYGIGGMELRFILRGELGATQFVYYTGQHLPHVAEELWEKHDTRYGFNPFRGVGADIGYHSKIPQHEGQKAIPCDLLPDGQCYYDGSSLAADDFVQTFFAGGTDAVWAMLEERYADWLEKETP